MRSKFSEDSQEELISPPDSIHNAADDVINEKPANEAQKGKSIETPSTDHVQETLVPTVPLNKRQKVKRHCGRFKWWYLGGVAVILIILIPLIFTKIIPAIVKDIVRRQKLPIVQGSLQVLSPTQLSVTMETQIDTPLAATIDPTTLFFYNKDTPEYLPFINITLPKVNANHKTKVAVENQVVDVMNEAELVKWLDRVYAQPKTALSLKGKTTVHLGALKTHVTIDRTNTAASLNELRGFGIANLTLILPPRDDGTNIKGYLNLPNSGVLGLGLGNLTFDIHSGDTKLGFITATDVLLNPGDNSPSFHGQLYLDEILPNLGPILDSQSSALADGNIDLRVSGNSTIVNGEHIGYVEQVLNKKSLIATVPVAKLLADLLASFSSGDASLGELLGDTFGNSTFLEGLLDHWTQTADTTGHKSSAVRRTSTQGLSSRTIKPETTKILVRMGLKMALAKL